MLMGDLSACFCHVPQSGQDPKKKPYCGEVTTNPGQKGPWLGQPGADTLHCAP